MGSLAAVLCAKQISPNVRVVLVSESDKIAPPFPLSSHPIENNDPGEVIEAWDFSTQRLYQDHQSENLEVENIYFEWVPTRYVDVYITEKGVMDAEQIQGISIEKEMLEKEIFNKKIIALAGEIH
jgi:translation initiation factor 2B subunit (eIF-2B alpha/beta/delta family)